MSNGPFTGTGAIAYCFVTGAGDQATQMLFSPHHARIYFRFRYGSWFGWLVVNYTGV